MLRKIFDINMRMVSISRYSQIHLVMRESVLDLPPKRNIRVYERELVYSKAIQDDSRRYLALA